MTGLRLGRVNRGFWESRGGAAGGLFDDTGSGEQSTATGLGGRPPTGEGIQGGGWRQPPQQPFQQSPQH
eukprot:9739411-Alexandrium_andersonii.AAC.1